MFSCVNRFSPFLVQILLAERLSVWPRSPVSHTFHDGSLHILCPAVGHDPYHGLLPNLIVYPDSLARAVAVPEALQLQLA